jgi:hypothetical protein
MDKSVFLPTRVPNMSDLKGPECSGGAFRLRHKGIYSTHRNWHCLGPERADIHPSVQDAVILVGLRVTERFCVSRNSNFFSTEIQGKFVTIGPKEKGGSCVLLQVLELASKRSMHRRRKKFL